MPGEPGHCHGRRRPPWWPSRGVLPSKVLQLHQQRWVILRVDSLALWKIINEEDAVLIPQNRGENFSSGFLHSEFFWGEVSRYAPIPLNVALSPGHSDITRFRPSSPIVTGNNLDRAEKRIQICSDDWHRWRFWSAFRHFGTHLAESFRMSKSLWMTETTRSREMPSCSAIDFAEIRRSSKISSWIWSIISGVVTVLGRLGRGASQVEKSPRLKTGGTQFLAVAYDGACSPNVSIRMAWISFGALPCREGGPWWQLASRCCWNHARRLTCFLSASVTRKDLFFGTWTDSSFQRHDRFRPTTSGSRSV